MKNNFYTREVKLKTKAVGNAKRYLKKSIGSWKGSGTGSNHSVSRILYRKITQKKVLETLNISRTTYN